MDAFIAVKNSNLLNLDESFQTIIVPLKRKIICRKTSTFNNIIKLNLEYFIAKKIIANKSNNSVSTPIVKIAIAAIAIGMVMMIISIATGIGLQKKIQEKVAAFNGHVIISTYDDNQSDVSITPISTDQDFYPKFNQVEGIQHIQAVATKAGIIRTHASFEGITFKGVGADYQWKHITEYLVEGRLPNFKQSISEEIIISQHIANRLNLKVGDKAFTYFLKEEGNPQPYNRAFKIVGIYTSGIQEFDATYVIGDIKQIQRMNKWSSDQVGAFEIFLDDFSQINSKGKEIYENTFNYKDASQALDTQTIEEKYYSIFEWLKMFDINIQIILIVMILVATINMAVALLVLILERTQMIGILKALGASNWTVRKIFLYNALYLISRGLIFGNLIAIAIIILQNQFSIIKLDPVSYHVSTVPMDFNPFYIVLLNIGTILVCLIVLVIPSYIIVKISPVKAIRFD